MAIVPPITLFKSSEIFQYMYQGKYMQILGFSNRTFGFGLEDDLRML